jgi:hypothetical protein
VSNSPTRICYLWHIRPTHLFTGKGDTVFEPRTEVHAIPATAVADDAYTRNTVELDQVEVN